MFTKPDAISLGVDVAMALEFRYDIWVRVFPIGISHYLTTVEAYSPYTSGVEGVVETLRIRGESGARYSNLNVLHGYPSETEGISDEGAVLSCAIKIARVKGFSQSESGRGFVNINCIH